MRLEDVRYPIFDPRAVGFYRHHPDCDPEYGCVCGMDAALLDAERIAWELER